MPQSVSCGACGSASLRTRPRARGSARRRDIRVHAMPPPISVVVPIYNVERYLEECLDSIVAQTFGDLEVVMVDDGSTDSSAAIAQRYAARDGRFRLLSQRNGGLGKARNTGIDA